MADDGRNGSGGAGIATADPGAGDAPSSLPMFYRRPLALNPERHGRFGLVTKPSYGFARAAHAIPVMAGEIQAAMRSYPIVFVGPRRMPVAITGLRRDQNLFVDAAGEWARPHYVPAYVRRYPFVLAGEDDAERLTLCVDMESERIVETASAGGAASPLFEGDQPGEATRQALAFCEQYQAMLNLTRAIVVRIGEHGLFAERQSKVTLEGGETFNLTDFQVVDEAALNRLDDAAFLDLRGSGVLPFIYCHLASMQSWTSLLHQANARGGAKA